MTEKNFPNVTRTLIIDVAFEKLPKGIQGCCMVNDDGEYVISLAPNQTREELIVNTCHELVHVMQEESGYEFDYSVPYEDQVHEIEAYAMQDMYAEAYNEKIKSRKKV